MYLLYIVSCLKIHFLIVISGSKAEYDPKTVLTKNRIRVAAYCRVSTLSDEQETSIINQKTYYKNYIEKKPDWLLVDIYSDEVSQVQISKEDLSSIG